MSSPDRDRMIDTLQEIEQYSTCPECKGQMIHSSGCMVCVVCGYSPCKG
jgi:hypothetical protein